MSETPGNKPPTPGPPKPPPGRTKWLGALAGSRVPLRPIEVYEKGNKVTVPGPERGTVGNATAAELRALVRTGEVYSVYRDDQPENAIRYGLTALGKSRAGGNRGGNR